MKSKNGKLVIKLWVVLLLLPSALTLMPIRAWGQPAPLEIVIHQIDESRLPEITLDFEVKTPDGEPFLDAKIEDFQVEEYGESVEVREFLPPKGVTTIRSATLVLVLDRSGSMADENRIGGLKQAVNAFLDLMPAGSKIAVVSFSGDVFAHPLNPRGETSARAFTTDLSQVRSHVNGLRPHGDTRYYDSVRKALELLSRETGRRAVVALTDGADNASREADLDSVIREAGALGLPVYALGLGSEELIEAGALKRLAVETRGEYFPARQAGQLRVIFEEIAKGLKNSYSLVYRTGRPLPDGTLRPVKLSYRRSISGEISYFVEGMVVPAAGWSPLLLALTAGLIGAAWLPVRFGRRRAGGS